MRKRPKKEEVKEFVENNFQVEVRRITINREGIEMIMRLTNNAFADELFIQYSLLFEVTDRLNYDIASYMQYGIEYRIRDALMQCVIKGV